MAECDILDPSVIIKYLNGPLSKGGRKNPNGGTRRPYTIDREVCCWETPSQTYDDFVTGLTQTYNEMCLRDQTWSSYVTKLFKSCLSGSSSGGTMSFTVQGDNGTPFTITNGDTLDFEGSTGIDIGVSDPKVLVAIDYSGVDSFIMAASNGTSMTVDGASDKLVIYDTDAATVKYINANQLGGIGNYWSANTLGISNSGLTNENVGIGTNTPNKQLTVAGEISGTSHLTIDGDIIQTGTTSVFSNGVYTEIGTGFANTGQLTFNANHDGGVSTNTYTPSFAGNANAGMTVVKMPSGGYGGLDFYVKNHGTTSGSQNLSTFTKILELNQDGNSSFGGNINMIDGKYIYPDDGTTNTYIRGTSDDLYIASDDDLFLQPDDDLYVAYGTTNYAQFDGSVYSLTIGGAATARLNLGAPNQTTFYVQELGEETCTGKRIWMDMYSGQVDGIKLAIGEQAISEENTILRFLIGPSTVEPSGEGITYPNQTDLIFAAAAKSSTCSNEVLRVAGVGKVGILNAAPTYTLDVTGTFRSTSNAIIGGSCTINSIAAAGAGYTGNKILVSDSGVVEYLTGAQLAQDIGFEGQYWTGNTDGSISTSGITKVKISGDTEISGQLSVSGTGENYMAGDLNMVGANIILENTQAIRFENTGGVEFGQILMNSSNDMIFQNSRTGSDVLIRAGGSGSGDTIFTTNQSGTNSEIMRLVGDTAHVGVGTATPNKPLTVEGDISGSTDLYTSNVYVTSKVVLLGDDDTFIQFAEDAIGITAGGEQLITISESGQDIVKIGDGGDVDFQVRTENDNNTLYVLGETDKVGIGTNTPNEKLTVVGAISGTTNLLVDGVGIGVDSPSSALHISTSDNVIVKVVSTDSIATIELGDNSTSNQATLTRVANDLKICKDGGNVGLPIAPKTKLDVQHNPTSLSNDTGGGESVTFGTEDGTDTLTAGKLMYLNSSGVWKYADASAASTSTNLLAIALGTAVSDGLLIRGFFDSSSVQGVFAKGAPVYVSESAGAVDFTAPSTSGDIIRIIGHATDTANVIYFNPDGTWVELT